MGKVTGNGRELVVVIPDALEATFNSSAVLNFGWSL